MNKNEKDYKFSVKINELVYEGKSWPSNIKYNLVPKDILDSMDEEDLRVDMQIVVNDCIVSEIGITRKILNNYIAVNGVDVTMDIKFPEDLIISMYNKVKDLVPV